MARTDPQLNLRLPASLKARLEAAAAESKRTVTAEAVERLEGSFEQMPDALVSVIMRMEVRALNAEFLAGSLKRVASGMSDSLMAFLSELPREMIESNEHLRALNESLSKYSEITQLILGEEFQTYEEQREANLRKHEELKEAERKLDEIRLKHAEGMKAKSSQ
ncbi:Arc family DNA-binding protein [Massilia sp. YIM B02763]|uniref:Arc family DNA-binding protein n=1 Tax=Massilia sp. YIM B02763 TaxID=3050130 RepID=UPI0025B6943E|nr:Arc family DNA-binding protein [Massilia sp. YIM B02763]MDN4052880.1 Arc family DNA-binding protein [Massilia sp. YIM B02763]